jgi:hypothetical protein
LTASTLVETASAPRVRSDPSRKDSTTADRATHGPVTAAPAPPPPAGPWPRYKRLTHLGWPKRFPLIQFPNIPLMVAFLAAEATHLARGSAHADASAISYLAMTVWAYEELIRGVNWFRRLLGLAYLGSTVVHLALALGFGPPRPLSEIVARADFAICRRVTRPAESRATLGL